jgi:hypothetical protein
MALPDAFTRANNTDLGTEWDSGYTSTTNARIFSNAVRSVTINTESIEQYNAFTPTADQWASVTLTSVAAPNCLVGVILRAQPMPSPVTFYFIAAGGFTSANYTVVKKRINFTDTQLLSQNTPWVAGDTLRAEISGSVITVWRNGVLTWTCPSDTGITSAGKVGLYLWVATGGALTDAQLDDFNAGNLGAGQPTMRRWGGTPSMLAGNLIGRTW